MMSGVGALLSLVAFAACTHGKPTPAPQPQYRVESTPLLPGHVHRLGEGTFKPVVAQRDTVGECKLVEEPGGRRVVVFISPTSADPRQSASIAIDSAGSMVTFSERWGDMHGKGEEPSTTVSVNFTTAVGVAMNQVPGAPTDMSMGTVAEAEAQPELHVLETIARIRQHCLKQKLSVPSDTL